MKMKSAALLLLACAPLCAQLGTIQNETFPQFRADLNRSLGNGVAITGSYLNPAWISSLAWSKLTGSPLSTYTVSFTNVTSFVVPASQHGFPDANMVVTCSGGVAECGDTLTVDPVTLAVTMTSTIPITGTMQIAGGPAYVATFSNATSATLTGTLARIPAWSCYLSSGAQFGANSATATPHDAGMQGFQGYDYSISLSSLPVSGRCVFLRN